MRPSPRLRSEATRSDRLTANLIFGDAGGGVVSGSGWHVTLLVMPRHTYLCPMRWADQDPFGHVNNTMFVAYLEQARIDLFFHHASSVGVPTFAEGTVIARHEIDYLRPVRYRHRPLRIELWCSKMAGATFTVDYELFDPPADGTDAAGSGVEPGVFPQGPVEPAEPTDQPWVLAARARSLLVPYDLAAGRPRRLTSEEREFLRRFAEEQAA